MASDQADAEACALGFGAPLEGEPIPLHPRFVVWDQGSSGMQSKVINQEVGQRTFVIVLDTGDEVMASLRRFVEREKLRSGQFTAIGAFRSACLGYFDWERKDYGHIPVSEQVEVASFIGDLATSPDGKPSLHIHCVLGCRDGRAIAGHLLEAHVRPTLEIVWRDSPAHLRKRHDANSGLALIDLDAPSS